MARCPARRSADENKPAGHVQGQRRQAGRGCRVRRGADLRGRLPTRRQARGRRRRRRRRPADRPRDRARSSSNSRPPPITGPRTARPPIVRPWPAARPSRCRDRSLPEGAKVVSLDVAAASDRTDRPLRLRPVAGHRQARLGRDARRHPDGDRDLLDRGIVEVTPTRAVCSRRPTARRQLRVALGGQTVDGAGHAWRAWQRRSARFRPRRGAGALEARLQRGHLPRLGPGQERLQTLPPRLRPDLRRPGPDRRPGRPACQSWPRPTTA